MGEGSLTKLVQRVAFFADSAFNVLTPSPADNPWNRLILGMVLQKESSASQAGPT